MGPSGPAGSMGPAGPAGAAVNETCYAINFNSEGDAFEEAYAVAVPLNRVQQVTVRIVGRNADGSGRAAFERKILVFNESGAAEATGYWHTAFTAKSDAAFDIRYRLSGTALRVDVKSPIDGPCAWKGSLCIMEVGI